MNKARLLKLHQPPKGPANRIPIFNAEIIRPKWWNMKLKNPRHHTAVKEKAFQLEARYLVKDGEIIHFRFNV
jgi:hypothetical protein